MALSGRVGRSATGVGRGDVGAGAGGNGRCIIRHRHKCIHQPQPLRRFSDDVSALVGVVFPGDDVQQQVGPIITGANGRIFQKLLDIFIRRIVQHAVRFQKDEDFEDAEAGHGHISIDAQFFAGCQIHDEHTAHAAKRIQLSV